MSVPGADFLPGAQTTCHTQPNSPACASVRAVLPADSTASAQHCSADTSRAAGDTG